jgi:hypothetical protein
MLADTVQEESSSTHPPTQKKDQESDVKYAVKDKSKNERVKGDNKENDKESQANDKGDTKVFTADQDAQITMMHGEGKTWREIAKEIKRSQKDCQNRLEELRSNSRAKDGGENKSNGDIQTDRSNGKGGKNNKSGAGKTRKKKRVDKNTGMRGRLEPDEIWTREDCEVLEMLEERYKEEKWLHMQSSFYNLTGRMVVAGIIENKFSEAEK